MTYEELVSQVREAYEGVDASKLNDHVAFQFNVTGEAEGAFYLEIKDGKVSVEPYEYYDRDVLVTASADIILQIAHGDLDPVKAFLTGKIKAEGNLGKAAFLKELNSQEKAAKKTAAKKAAEDKTAARKGRKTEKK